MTHLEKGGDVKINNKTGRLMTTVKERQILLQGVTFSHNNSGTGARECAEAKEVLVRQLRCSEHKGR